MKLKIPILIFLLSLSNLFGQTNPKIDSLKQVLLKVGVEDTTKVSIYLALSGEFLEGDLDSYNLYARKALKLSLLNDNYKLADTYNSVGLIYRLNYEADSATYYFDKALALLDINDDIVLRSTLYGNYSLLYSNSNQFDKSLEYNLKAIDLMKGNDSELCIWYFNHAILYEESGFRNQFKKYMELAYKSSLKGNNIRVEGLASRAYAYALIEEGKIDSAKIYLDKGLELCERTKSPEICHGVNQILGIFYDNLELFEKAEIALLEANKYALIHKNKYNILDSYVFLGQNEFKRKNYNKAEQYYQEFESLYNKDPILVIGVDAYKSWSELEAERGNYKKANALLKEHIAIKDSLYSKASNDAMIMADVKYETAKKDKEIIQQQLQLEQNKNELQKRKIRYNYMTGMAAFLLVTSLLLWFLFQQRRKRKNQEILALTRKHQVETLESLMEGEEKERFRIAKELHDGVNGDLSAIKYKLTSLIEKNNTVVNEAVAMIDKSCEQVRAISHNLIPPSLEKFNLIEAVDGYCNTINDIHAPKITFQHIGDEINISKKEEVNIFRIIQELVANSIKHAEANEINVQISSRNNNLQITVEDNGKGFNKDKIQGDGIGLQNIQSRVDYLNATMDMVSNSKGTSNTIEIDINKR